MEAQAKIKVAFYVFFPAGGIGHYTNLLLRSIEKKSELDYEVICLPECRWATEYKFPVWPNLFSISHPWPWLRKVRFLAAQFVNPGRLFKRVKETQCQIVHLCNLNHLSYPFWERFIDSNSVILGLSVHDVRRAKSIVSRKWESWQLKRIYRRADALFVHSNAQLEDLIQFAQCQRERVHIVPLGIFEYPKSNASKSILRRKLGIPLSAVVGLFFGNLRDEKNLSSLVKAVKAIKRVDLYLLVVGRDAPSGHRTYKDYQREINDLSLGNRVIVKNGFVQDNIIGEYFEISDFSVLPYKKTFTSQSAVLNTAVHFRKPVLVTPCPTLVETLTQYDIGVICNEDNADSIRSGMEALIARIENNESFEFDSYAVHFSWDRNAEITTSVYKTLLSGQDIMRK